MIKIRHALGVLAAVGLLAAGPATPAHADELPQIPGFEGICADPEEVFVSLADVIDFIQWYYEDYYWPAFNIADSAITVGAGLLILDAFLGMRSRENA